MADVEKLIERAATDSKFRAEVLQNESEALGSHQLSAADRDRLLQEIQMIEAGVQEDPVQPTMADEGEADAAASKG